ncbi:MAG TPA: adenylosuccinate lyase [Verrucomicrobia bacterium]|nr:adenylosuccinate lyase [Verrucomicrobiota bacterium]
MIERYTRPEMGALWTDEQKFQTWLAVELAACEAMAKAGKIPQKDWREIHRKAAFDAKRIRKIEAEVRHDVIAFLTSVAEKVGPAARHIHKGMTSSDVVDTALSVNLVKAADFLIAGIEKVRAASAKQAAKHAFTPMIGRSHGIHAEPTTFGLKMALMYDEFGRALARLRAARETVRVGKLSGAVGTHAHLDPKIEAAVCRKLGLKPAAISTQILQRDRHAEYAAALALAGTSVERWAQEFRHLQRTEVREVEEFFGQGQKGSSAMPHKKNPVVAEQLCGLARVLRGYALTAMENVPLWHERDISHSSAERIILPDATILLDYMLAKLVALVAGMKVDAGRMQANLDSTHGLIHSQQVLLLLVEKGVAREDAYRWVQRNAMESWKSGRPLLELAASDPDIAKVATRRELAACFDLKRHFRAVKRTFRAVGLPLK